MTRYVVRSGDSYVCQDNGDALPLMPSSPKDALRHTLEEAARRVEFMEERGFVACIEKEIHREWCLKCNRLMELYGQTPKQPRDYWLMTELFVMLHGGDVCKVASDEGENVINPD